MHVWVLSHSGLQHTPIHCRNTPILSWSDIFFATCSLHCPPPLGVVLVVLSLDCPWYIPGCGRCGRLSRKFIISPVPMAPSSPSARIPSTYSTVVVRYSREVLPVQWSEIVDLRAPLMLSCVPTTTRSPLCSPHNNSRCGLCVPRVATP